jgi:hypothetical protein
LEANASAHVNANTNESGVSMYFQTYSQQLRLIMVSCALLAATPAQAGVDIAGPVQRVQIAPDGKLWFGMDTTPASTYCQVGWHSLTMYVPKEHPEYPYYFAMLMTAASKGKAVYVANINVFNGSTPCDITKTGYGLVFMQ